MAARTVFVFKHRGTKKKSRQGSGTHSKGMKKYRGQGGPRKRCKKPKK